MSELNDSHSLLMKLLTIRKLLTEFEAITDAIWEPGVLPELAKMKKLERQIFKKVDEWERT